MHMTKPKKAIANTKTQKRKKTTISTSSDTELLQAVKELIIVNIPLSSSLPSK